MQTPKDFNDWSPGRLPGVLGIEITGVGEGKIAGSLPLRDELLAPNGYLHAATVVALADTLCGYGTMANLPPNAYAFTTIELKTNFLGTAREGSISAEASLAHGGRTTQVWDASVVDDAKDKKIALFRCTQLLLYPE